MREYLPGVICLIILIYSIYKSLHDSLAKSNLDEAITPIISTASTIISFFIIIGYYEKLDILIGKLLIKVIGRTLGNNGLLHICVLLGIFELIRFLIIMILKVLHKFSLNSAINILNRNKPFLVCFSIIFGIIRGLILIILICIPLVIYNGVVDENLRISLLDNFTPYNRMEALVDKGKVEIISNGVIENISNSKIVYYNGITIEEGVESNEDIRLKALEITKRCETDREKAEALYKWIGSNIRYDDEKAIKVMEENVTCESGAIVTFRDRKGICFDYSCLYVAMAKEVNLKVRLIVGEAFNGESFISHAWNQVYLADEGKWVNLDTTFYVAGDYFDTPDFEKEHVAKSIAGEF